MTIRFPEGIGQFAEMLISIKRIQVIELRDEWRGRIKKKLKNEKMLMDKFFFLAQRIFYCTKKKKTGVSKTERKTRRLISIETEQ